MVSFSEKRRNGAQPILQKSFRGVWGAFPNKRKVAPSRLACHECCKHSKWRMDEESRRLSGHKNPAKMKRFHHENRQK
jgi:hypothetical protein